MLMGRTFSHASFVPAFGVTPVAEKLGCFAKDAALSLRHHHLSITSIHTPHASPTASHNSDTLLHLQEWWCLARSPPAA